MTELGGRIFAFFITVLGFFVTAFAILLPFIALWLLLKGAAFETQALVLLWAILCICHSGKGGS